MRMLFSSRFTLEAVLARELHEFKFFSLLKVIP